MDKPSRNAAPVAPREYSVVQFFQDGTWEYVRRAVALEEAGSAFKHYTGCVAAKMGLIARVIITDAGDFTNAEWVYGKGLVYPTKEMLEEARRAES